MASELWDKERELQGETAKLLLALLIGQFCPGVTVTMCLNGWRPLPTHGHSTEQQLIDLIEFLCSADSATTRGPGKGTVVLGKKILLDLPGQSQAA